MSNKKPVTPVPDQDKTQFPLSSVMEAKPKQKESDIFDAKARGEQKMKRVADSKASRMKRAEERKKNPIPKRTKKTKNKDK